MFRQDDNNLTSVQLAQGALTIRRIAFVATLVAIVGGRAVEAGEIRLWSTAVVTGQRVVMRDIGRLTGMTSAKARELGDVFVTAAPEPGGSRMVHLEMIRSALADNGANMARMTISGATRCAVSRPAAAKASLDVAATPESGVSSRRGAPPTNATTLRQAVFDFFNRELVRFHGRAEVVFDSANEQVLDLSGPGYHFDVRRKKGAPLGLLTIEVGVLANGNTVQSVEMAVRVTMIRSTVLARRGINLNATIGPSDLDFVPMSFTRVDNLGLDDVKDAIGQRAKRFIGSGMVVESSMLEQVPLVHRGQLVTVLSKVNGVSVVTAGKAAASGLLGERIRIRATDDRRIEFGATVVGPAAVEVGGVGVLDLSTALVLGGKR